MIDIIHLMLAYKWPKKIHMKKAFNANFVHNELEFTCYKAKF
jgi:hypothetical protein